MALRDKIILEMKDISKSFSGNKVLNEVRLEIKEGSCHALLGENGAGKSTLMKILIGLYSKDGGTMSFHGKPLEVNNVHDSLQAGISMVHQELSVVNEMTVAENIFLGKEIKGNVFVNEKAQNARTRELMDQLKISIPPNSKMKNLSTGMKQMVEIAKAVSNNAKLIIMDEPTSAITDREVEALFAVIETLKSEGISIIYISHRMEEIFRICDEITVLRDGNFVDTVAVSDVDKNKLVNMMVGRELTQWFPTNDAVAGEVALKVENLTIAGKFNDISFELKKGEILGVSGLIGAGRSELINAIYGIEPPESGKIYVNGKEEKINSPSKAISLGMGLLTEDRRETGIFPQLSLRENMVMPNLKTYRKMGLLSKKKIQDDCIKQRERLSVKSRGLNQIISTLSGGNQQKVLFARWLLMTRDILLVDEPTRGIDVGAKYEIYKVLCEMAKNGKAVLMVSSELPEVLGISNRILVMHEGKLTGILNNEDIGQEHIMELAVL